VFWFTAGSAISAPLLGLSQQVSLMPHRGVRTASTLACRGGAHSGAHEAGISYEVYRTIVGKGGPEDAVTRGRSRDRPPRTARCAQTGHRYIHRFGAAQPPRGYVPGRANGAPFWGAAACRVKPELPSVHLFSAKAGPSESCLGTPPAAGRAWVHRAGRDRTLVRLFFLRRIGRLVNP
jgi:hypothetical protein